jgi:hypothetical protein
MYSKQKGYCRICGEAMMWTPNTPYIKNAVCSKKCHREFNWRETLSIMGKNIIQIQIQKNNKTGG